MKDWICPSCRKSILEPATLKQSAPRQHRRSALAKCVDLFVTMREFFKGWRLKVGCAALLTVVIALIVWFQQKAAVQHRIQGLLQTGQPLEFYIPVVRSTHSRIIQDRRSLQELAKAIVIWDFERRDGMMPTAGGIAIYIEPIAEPHFRLIVAETWIFAEFDNGQSFGCTVTKGRAMKKAAEMAGFQYPLSFEFPPPESR